MQRVFPALILVLDIIHVVEYLWKAAYAFHEPESEDARLWVSERLLRILNGEVSLVVRGMRYYENSVDIQKNYNLDVHSNMFQSF